MMYNHIQIKTEYSLSKGAIFYSQAPKLAKQNNMNCLGICDDGNMFGSYEFAKECTKNKIKPIIGCSLKIKHDNRAGIINLFAKDDDGLKNLFWLSSQTSLDKTLEGHINLNLLKDHTTFYFPAIKKI